MNKLFRIIWVLMVIPGLSSCLGVNADIVLNADNSGTISIEYRISGLLESIGRLDGNEAYPIVPVGRTDLERTIARIPGMKLLSYNTRDQGNDKLVNVRLEFGDINALMNFLDATGEKAVYSGGPSSQKLTLVLSQGRQNTNNNLDEILRSISAGYRVVIGMTFPSGGELRLLDNEGRPLSDNITGTGLVPTGRKVSCALDLETVLFAERGISAEFIW